MQLIVLIAFHCSVSSVDGSSSSVGMGDAFCRLIRES